MSVSSPPPLVTEIADVDPIYFDCCKKADLQLFKCPDCVRIMCHCNSCEILFTNMLNRGQRTLLYPDQIFQCPSCNHKFDEDESFWLADTLQVTRQDMNNAQLKKFLRGWKTPKSLLSLQGDSLLELIAKAKRGKVTGNLKELNKPSSPKNLHWYEKIFAQGDSYLFTRRNLFMIVGIAFIVALLTPLIFLGVRMYHNSKLYFNASGIYQGNFSIQDKPATIQLELQQQVDKMIGKITITTLTNGRGDLIEEPIEVGHINKDSLVLRSTEIPNQKGDNVAKIFIIAQVTNKGVIQGTISLYYPPYSIDAKNIAFEAQKY